MTTRRPDAPNSTMQDDEPPPASGLSSMQRAILTIQKMRTKIEGLERTRVEPIAIIGMGCRFPGGANSPESFFRILEEGVDAVTEVPAERWQIAVEESTDAETRAVRFGAFLRDIDLFDAGFFSISPREASKMDPQQRLLLEVTWEALERAGQLPERLVNSRTGVFLGIMTNDYEDLCALAGIENEDAYTTTGNGHSFPAGRISYTFGFQGPSIAIDTACSSSLVAMHLACQSLRNGETNMAVAGGVNLMLVPSTTRKYAKLSALSPDGRCKTFDSTANGFVRGEGCGMLVLKRLSDAEKDGDTILALIRGSAVNQDGRSTGLTTPNVLAQQTMLRQALENARVAPSDVSYVEAHGTGTPLGDPIEVEALKTVLGGPREKGSVCVLGAVKTNIGHLEAAAGVAGIMKVVLALQNESIPGNLHFRALNPRIDFRGTTLEIARTAMPWKSGIRPRFAGVSSFGLSGTNAHVVLEEAPRNLEEPIAKEASAYLLPISAKSPEALAAHVRAYHAMLTSPDSPRLLDIVYTASSRRSHFEHRFAAVGGSKEELASALDGYLRGEAPAGVSQGKAAPARAKVVFVFSGQGSQWIGMGKKLYDDESAFRSVIDSCDALLMGRLGWSLLDELDSPEHVSRIGETQVAQPLIFAIQIALVELLRSWGISPDAVIGHSVGEIAAAYIAGILSLDEAIRLVAIRGRIMQKATGLGKMISVSAPLDTAKKAIAGYEGKLSIAAVNDPGSIVLAGDTMAMDEVQAKLERQGVVCRPLRVNYAFHSPQMEPLAAELVERLTRVDARRATLAMYSTVLSECVDGKELDVRYWGRNIRETVNLAGAVDSAIHDGYQLFLEVGPHPVLTSNVQHCLSARKTEGLATYSLRRNQDDRRALLETAAALYTRGCAIEWPRVVPAGGRCVALPAYPWRRERYWVDGPPAATLSADAAGVVGGARAHPLLGIPFDSSRMPSVRLWQRHVSLASLGVVRDHVVAGDVVFPGASYIETALAAAAEVSLSGSGATEVAHIVFERILSLASGDERILESSAALGDQRSFAFQISSSGVDSPKWTRHFACELVSRQWAPEDSGAEAEDVAAIRARCPLVMRGDEHYHQMKELGLSYGAAFRVVRELYIGDGLGIARLSVADEVGSVGEAVIRLDGAFQLLASLALQQIGNGARMTLVPASIERIRVMHPFAAAAWAVARIKTLADGAFVGDVSLCDENGAVCLVAEGLVLRGAAPAMAQLPPWLESCLFAVEWRQSERAPARGARSNIARGGFLVLCDALGVADALVPLLGERGERVVRAFFGERFEKLGPDTYSVEPTRFDDYEALLKDAFGHEPCQGVLHLGHIGGAGFGSTTVDSLAADQRTGSISVLRLVQALVRFSGREAPRLWIVTRGAQGIAKGETPSIGQSTVWGLARTIALEHSEFQCTRIDLDPQGEPLPMAHALLAEVGAAGFEDQVALRPSGRYVARFCRVGLAAPSEGLSIRPEGSYLITGGLGGLGLSLAKWMVAQGARNVMLVGRRPPNATALVDIRSMEEAGARVLVIAADISNGADVAEVFARIDALGVPLRGVVHAAAALADHTVLELSEVDLIHVLEPKLLGAFHLHRATLGRELDFFVLYSSVAGVLGSSGQANYSAANAAMDALAVARRSLGLVATSVAWGPFSEVGLAAAQQNRGSRLALRGLESMSPDEGNRILLPLLSMQRADVSVMRFDVRRWLEAQPQAAVSAFFSELRKERGGVGQAKTSKTSFKSVLEAKPESERYAALDAHVRQQISKVFRIEQTRVDMSASFTSLGMDSLMSIELRNHLESSLSLKLPATLLFTYANGATLTTYLLGRLLPKEETAPAKVDESATTPPSPTGAEQVSDDDLLAAFDASMTSIKDEGLL